MREAATVERPVVLSGAEKRRALVSQAKAQWNRGERANAKAVLEEHPELAEDRNAVIDLVFEEFALRRQAGENIDPIEFANQFSRYKSSVRKVLMMHDCMEGNPHLLPVGDEDGWPVPGETLLGFSVLGELGRGSFARVYLATQPNLGDRRVAIKVSRRGGAEAHILGQLEHDNIVPVHSVQEDKLTGWTIVCMPYFGKATLEDVVDLAFAEEEMPAQGRILLDAARPPVGMEPSVALKPPSAALSEGSYVDAVVEIGIHLAEALAFAHARQIYHRDLKPSNVLIGPDGLPRILDFNLSVDAKADRELLGGTLVYMPPEQLRATDSFYDGPPEMLEARSDLFSLGVILFELLTGKHPFGPIPWKLPQQELRRELLERQQRGPANLRELNPNVSPELAEVIARCLAWRSEDRFASAEELTEALRRCVKPAPRRGSRLRKLVMAAVLLVATGAFAAYYRERVSASENHYEQAVEAYDGGHFGQAHTLLTQHIDQGNNTADVLFFRGRVAMKMGEWEAAREDFARADELRPDGKTKACLAYCYTMGPRPKYLNAYLEYLKALDVGFENAVVLNNLGECCKPTRQPGKINEGLDYLERAVKLDPTMQVAYQNIIQLDLAAALLDKTKTYKPTKGTEAAKNAIELGAGNGHLYKDCAIVYLLVAERDPILMEDLKDKALWCLEKAIEHGVPAADVDRDALFASLRSEARYQRALQLRERTPLAPRPSYAINPLSE